MTVIFVDSSVWIDYFRGDATIEADHFDKLLGEADFVVGDLVLTEVLQGFDREADFLAAQSLMLQFDIVVLGGRDIALSAARNYRTLRMRGVTPRKTIDTLIATWCIVHDVALLARDRDFAPFTTHLGLRSALV